MPLAPGWGVEMGLTLDVLGRGFRVLEVGVPFHHRVSGRDWRAQIRRGRQFWVFRKLRPAALGQCWRSSLVRREAFRWSKAQYIESVP